MFKEPQVMMGWLGEVLSPPECQRLAEFIGEGTAQQSRSALQR